MADELLAGDIGACRVQPGRYTSVAITNDCFWAIFGSARSSLLTRDNFVKSVESQPRGLASGIVLEHQHPIQATQTAGEGRRINRASVYMPLADYMSRRAAVIKSTALSR